MSGLPIPMRMIDRPRVAGLAVPWVNVRLADGGADFRGTHRSRVEQCWREGLCQSCGQRLGSPFVLLCGPRQRDEGIFDEPPLHPECARYAMRACPMVAGQRTHYAGAQSVATTARGGKCPESGCGCGGWMPDGGHDAAGEPAHPWFAIWVRRLDALVVTPDGRLHGGHVAPENYVRVREVPVQAEDGAA